MPTVENAILLVISVLILLVPAALALGYTVNWLGSYVSLLGGQISIHVPLP